MGIRFPKIFWFELISGAAVSLTLLTSYRSDSGIGIGEIGLGFSTSAGLLRAVGFKRFQYSDDGWRMSALPLGYLFLALLPLTLIGMMAETPGTSMRDWIAYVLSFGFILSLRLGRADVALVGKTFLVTLAVILLYQYLNGGFLAWYSIRFTGGAKNPNQLALYCACAGMISIVAFQRVILQLISVAYFCLFGLLARSDAYHATLVAVMAFFIIKYILPRRYALQLGLPIGIGAMTLILVYGGELDQFFGTEWRGADEGGARLVLYLNGLKAWLDSPLSFFLGNGAGNFSGLFGPFGKSEAHNTPIDLLTIGGLVGVLIFYWYPVRFALQAYSSRRAVLFAFYAGLLVFSLFHFVARHPVWWFSIYVVAWTLSHERALRKEVD